MITSDFTCISQAMQATEIACDRIGRAEPFVARQVPFHGFVLACCSEW